jgi:hypothetical protein
MASFAKIKNNIVIAVHSVVNEVIKDSNGVEQETIGIEFLKNLHGQDTNWKQTSYNTIGGVHLKGGTPLRKNHAGIGYTYDEIRDAFIAPKPNYSSWILNENTCLWEAPIPRPELTQEQKDNDQYYAWNEEAQNWILQTRNLILQTP